MSTAPNHNRIVLDDFTKKILEIESELIKKNAFPRKKKDFADVLGIPHVNLNHIERHGRNFPEEPEKRQKAKMGLYEKFGVDPLYMEGKITKMFFREPTTVETAVKKETVQYNFANKAEKEQLLNELETYKQKVAQLEAENKRLQDLLQANGLG